MLLRRPVALEKQKQPNQIKSITTTNTNKEKQRKGCSKYRKTKTKTGRVAHVIEHLPSKNETLSSNPSDTHTHTQKAVSSMH
jgi:hypothetical protein